MITNKIKCLATSVLPKKKGQRNHHCPRRNSFNVKKWTWQWINLSKKQMLTYENIEDYKCLLFLILLSIVWSFACWCSFVMTTFDCTYLFALKSSCELIVSFFAHVLASIAFIPSIFASSIIDDVNSLLTSRLLSKNYLNFLQIYILLQKSIKLNFIINIKNTIKSKWGKQWDNQWAINWI